MTSTRTMPSKPVLAAAGVGVVLALVAALATINKIAPVSSGLWGPINETDGIAIAGYDPVSYHTGKPQAGSADLSWEWGGAMWHFSSADNLAAFRQDPQAYAPQYGGFCATAVSSGFTAAVEPEVWHIDNGRLYLFNGDSPRADWLADLGAGVIPRGDANWQKR